jgi:hypothetical protein
MKQLTNPAQSGWSVVVNENFDAISGTLYAQDYSTTTGLTLGYWGGHVQSTSVAAGTIALDASNTVYVVAHRTTGVVSKATNTTNWDLVATYGRLFKATTSGSAITALEDWRDQPGGIFNHGAASGTVDADDVTYSPTTVADWDGSTDPGDVEQALDQLAERVKDLEGAGGGSGTKTYAWFTPDEAQPPASNYAAQDTNNSIRYLNFDDTTEWSAFWVHGLPEAASLGSGLKFTIWFRAISATSGNVRWGVKLEDLSASDTDSDSYDTAAEATVATSGTLGNWSSVTITLATIDSATAQKPVRISVYRDVTDGADTMAGNAQLGLVEMWSAA